MLCERKHTFSILDEFHWVKVIVSILLQKYHRHQLLQQMLGDLPFYRKFYTCYFFITYYEEIISFSLPVYSPLLLIQVAVRSRSFSMYVCSSVIFIADYKYQLVIFGSVYHICYHS